MVAAGNAVIGAENQRRAVAAVDGEVGRRQAAPGEREAGRQGDGRRHVEGAEAAGVFDGGGEAHQVAAIDIGDAAVDGSKIGDAAGERLAGAARGCPGAGRAADDASAASAHRDDAVLDRQHRLGDGRDIDHAAGDEMLLGRDRGQLVGLPQHGQRTIVGEGLVADRQGELHLDALAAQVAGGVAAKIENQRVAGADGHRIDVIGIRVAAAVGPLAGVCSGCPGNAGQVKQRQGHVGGELEVLVVAGGQVVGELEGDDVARLQFDIGRRRSAIDGDDRGRHGVGRNRQRGGGSVCLRCRPVSEMLLASRVPLTVALLPMLSPSLISLCG